MIKIKNISKSFWNFKALDNLNLEIQTWECFGLLGKNGAWKTTTIKMIVWLLKPNSWEILFDGRNMNDNTIEVKKELAYIPDTPYVYEKLTWMEFLAFIWNTYGLSDSQIKERAQKFIHLFNLEEVINKKTEEYSHGMRQKLIFISALIHTPKYLIVDEPMVWLDPQSNKMVKDMFKELTRNHGVSIILTTHQLSVAQDVCDRIWIINEWKLEKMLNNKLEFWENLENEFIRITWWYDKEKVKELFIDY